MVLHGVWQTGFPARTRENPPPPMLDAYGHSLKYRDFWRFWSIQAHPMQEQPCPPRPTMTSVHAPEFQNLPAVDLHRRYVRLLERRGDGLVSFEFSIGWPELAVQLMLPSAAFDEFCARNHVIWRED